MRDYTPGPYYVTFKANERTVEFNVNITDDTEVEDNETFHVFIVSVMNYDYNIEFHDPKIATVTIQDSDSKQLCAVILSC